METKLLQELFRVFAGDEKYRRFIRALNTASLDSDKLSYWQDSLWTNFVSTMPHCPREYSMIQKLFAICEIHDCDLLADTVLAPYSQLRYTRTQSPETGLQTGMLDNEKHPYLGWPVSPADWPPDENKLVDLLYCSKCRELRDEREHQKATEQSDARKSPVSREFVS